MKIIVNLRPVSVIKLAYRLQFHNYLPKAYKVCFVGLLKFYSIIIYLQFLFAFIRNSLTLKFNL